MREQRVPLSDLRPGEMIISIGSRAVGSRFRALHDVPAGAPAVGPRGGRYRMTAEGARRYVVLETYAGRPMVLRTSTAVVVRDEG